MNRYQAFLIHLSCSAIILLTILGFIILRFYPGFYFQAEGVWQATKIVMLVDLILGPLLTLIIFRVGKKGLKFDLAMIATVQLCALTYGSYVLYSERPGYLAFTIDRFEVAEASEVNYEGMQNPDLLIGPLSQPKVVYVNMPSEQEMQSLFNEFLEGGKDLYLHAQYYDEFAKHINEAVFNKLDSSQFLQTARDQLLMAEFLGKYGGTRDDYVFFPVVGNSDIMLAAVDPENGELVSVLAIKPWKDSIKAADQ